MNSYELTRNWFDWCFENPEKIKPVHHAVFFFAIEQCNRLGWKEKFGFPSQMVMEAVGIKSWKTYISALEDLVQWGFIKMIQKSKNQHSANVIAIVKKTKAQTKALDKATQTQCSLTVSINKPLNQETTNVQSEIVDARGLTQKQTAFLTWFNSMMLKHKNVQGKFRSMTNTDKNNLRNLRAAYEDITDWEKAFVSMTKSKWVIDNNKCTVDHFLRMDNFVKYLNEFEVTQSDKKKIRAPWD
jgi:hypothetical protein